MLPVLYFLCKFTSCENIVIIRIINRIFYCELEGMLRFVKDYAYRMRDAAVIGVICLSEPAVFTFAPGPYNAVGVNSKAVPESCGNSDDIFEAALVWVVAAVVIDITPDNPYGRGTRVVRAAA